MTNVALLDRRLEERLQNHLAVSPEKIAELCQHYSIQRLAVFGSILTDDFQPDSDIDFLVSVAPDLRLTLEYQESLETTLEKMVNREVDLVFNKNLERSENWIRKKSILDSAQVLYEA